MSEQLGGAQLLAGVKPWHKGNRITDQPSVQTIIQLLHVMDKFSQHLF